MPEIEAATTGFDEAIASMSAIGMPSICPSCATTLGITKMSHAPISRATSSCGTAPAMWMRPPIPCSAIHAFAASRIGPSPTIVHSRSRPSRISFAHASISTPKPLLGSSEATERSRSRELGARGSAAARA
jgi:hypothetical protein